MTLSRFKRFLPLGIALVLLAIAPLSVLAQTNPMEIKFYYPTAVGGPLSQIFDGYAAKFNAANPDLKVVATYAGGYDDITAAIQTEIQGQGEGPDVAVMLAADLPTFIDNGYIVPLQQFIDQMGADGKTYVSDFFPAFMKNSEDESGQIWAIPFQRSTPVLYYNKDLFQQVGLDPDHAPANRQELVDDGKKLTLPNGERWGLEIPSDGFPYWVFQSFAIGNGQNVVGDSFDQVDFNTPEVVSGLKFFGDLSSQYGIMPKGVIIWGDSVTDFTAGKTAMLYHTSGSLANILKNATFNVGVGFLPAGDKGYGTPTGGGNLYMFSTDPAKQAAAWRWIQFLSSPEIQADWSANTGYIAARQSAWDIDPLKSLAEKYPQYTVARDQLQYADRELATHDSIDVRNTLGKAITRVITGDQDAQTSLDQAQQEADAILSQYSDMATPEATAGS
ncbi:MAG TPA: ABC transporter substrate-binding protein [Phototrophicaceae bacterium]|nr:ABC transporter substrate-binding protein [Phototrophicaceae bacterium]